LTSVDSAYAAHARFVFFNDDGTQYYAIVQADAGSGLLNDFAILIPPGTGDPGGSNRAPVADAGPNQAALVGAGVSFDGGASSDADGDSLNFSWQILAAPAGSAAALVGAAASSAEFTPDLAGSYEIGLVVDDGDLSSTRDPVRLTAVNVGDSFLLQLRYPVTDAEYSDTLERIVSVSAVESRLYIFDTVDYHQTWLDLPLVPTSVSVSPDGLYAAVGHNGWISYVDLLANKLVDTISVSTDVFDIVLDGRGYAHAFPRINQWERIRSVEIATGIETLHTGNSVYAGTRARLHPGGDAIYGADNGLSPSDIEKYDVSVSPLQYLTDSPYHGDYAMCGDLWISEDGLRIFTRCGNVFRASSDPGLDMTYNGSMTSGAERLLSVTSSAEAGLIAAIIEDGSYSAPDPTADTRVQFYDHSFLVDDGNPVTLNAFAHHGNTYDAHGRWVFFNSDGSHFFGIVQADPSSGLVEDFGISVH
jgi:hypothetical protein